jgi:hypothetical protein
MSNNNTNIQDMVNQLNNLDIRMGNLLNTGDVAKNIVNYAEVQQRLKGSDGFIR